MGSGPEELSMLQHWLKRELRSRAWRSGWKCLVAICVAGAISAALVLLARLVLGWTQLDPLHFGFVPVTVAVLSILMVGLFASFEFGRRSDLARHAPLDSLDLQRHGPGLGTAGDLPHEEFWESTTEESLHTGRSLHAELLAFSISTAGHYVSGGMLGRAWRELWMWQACNQDAMARVLCRAVGGPGAVTLAEAGQEPGFTVLELAVLSRLPGVRVELLREGRIVVSDMSPGRQVLPGPGFEPSGS